MTESCRRVAATSTIVAIVAIVSACSDRTASPIADRGDDVEASIERVANSLQQPLVIEGRHFSARWVFDEDRMLDHDIRIVDKVEPGGKRPPAGETT